MQRRILFLLGSFILFVICMISYIYYLGSHLSDNVIKQYTGIENYKIESQLRNENEFLLVRILIDAKDGEYLKERYTFSYGYNPLVMKGKLFVNYLPQNPDNLYYLEETRNYGYVCLCLSSDEKHLTILDVFGD